MQEMYDNIFPLFSPKILQANAVYRIIEKYVKFLHETEDVLMLLLATN